MLPEVYVCVFAELRSKECTTTKTTRNRHYPGKITVYQKPGKRSTVHRSFLDQVNKPTSKSHWKRRIKNWIKKWGHCAQCQAASQRPVAAGWRPVHGHRGPLLLTFSRGWQGFCCLGFKFLKRCRAYKYGWVPFVNVLGNKLSVILE